MRYLFAISLLVASISCWSQTNVIAPDNITSAEQEVLDVVIKLFDGMREADSAKVHNVFDSKPELYTSFTNKEGEAVLHKDNGLQNFLNAVGTPHDAIWDEPIWDIKIHIDDNLASIWTNYAFYAGKNFSHCGVDAFMMNKTKTGWKIYHLTDTRRRQGCKVPDEIKKGRE